MASDDVRALAGQCEVGERLANAYLQHASECDQCEAHEADVTEWQNAVTAERVALARAVLASARRISDLPAVAAVASSFGCIHHEPAPPDPPREEEA